MKNEMHSEIGINRVVVVIKWNQLYEFHNHHLKVIHSCWLFLLTLITTLRRMLSKHNTLECFKERVCMKRMGVLP